MLGLEPRAVLAGQVWRLLTWGFFEFQFLNLFFACLLIFQLGPELARAWGGERFLAVCAGIVAATGAVTCLLAMLIRPLLSAEFMTVWPLALALTIAWASLTPHGVIQLFFVLPVPSRQVALVTVVITVVFGLMGGLGLVLPSLVAEGLMILYLRDLSPRRLWLNLRFSVLERKLRRHTSTLREVKRDASGPPRWFH